MRRQRTARDYLGGFAALVFVFGIVTFLMGGADPWGSRQVGGLIVAVVGIGLMFVRLWLPRK